jgi:serine/threonine protein kinase
VTDPILSRPPLRFARGELVFGYRLVRKLGEGSFGTVWLAANEKGFEWALKFVSLQGSGGIKEFKALQLIKDRKINNTNLLKLIDYGLLDHDGNSLASSASPLIVEPSKETPPAPPVDDPLAKAEPMLIKPQGTLMPAVPKPSSSRTAVEQLAARETQGASSDTKTAEKHRAAWLVIVMEVGQLTLHQLQLQQTEREIANQPHRQTRAVTRMGVTAGGSQTLSDGKPVTGDSVEEPLVPLPIATVLPYLEQAARGLDYLHRHEIVHRDIKPQNIILVADDAKVCDYGLASESTNSTATTIGCTPAYAAPEAINNRPVPASDQYSLAVTYIELVTGRWPFFGVTQTAIYREKDEGRHNLSFIKNRAARAVLKRALAKNPQDRFATCVEFAQKLTAAEKSTNSLFSPRPLAGATLAMLLLVIAGVGWAYQDQWLGRDPRPVVQNNELPLEIPANEPDPVPPGTVVPETPPAIVPTQPQVANESPPAKNADDELTAVFADAKLPPREALRTFENVVHNAADPTEWFVRLRSRANEDNAWLTATEQWLQRNLNRTPRPASLESREYQTFEQEFRAASLQRLLNQPLATPADLEAALASPALRLNDSHTLATLLRVDLEMRLAEAAASKSQLADWSGRIQSAQIPQINGKLAAQRNLFLIYLAALRLPAEVADPAKNVDLRAEGERLQELLNTSPQPGWLTADRKQLLAEPLGLVALQELGKTDRDLPVFHQFRLAANMRLSNVLTIATLHQLQSPSLAAAQSLVQASQAAEKVDAATDWRAIELLAQIAFHDKPTNDFLLAKKQRLLLFYVLQLSALKNAEPNSPELQTAIKGLATLLSIKQDNVQLFFDFEQPSQPTDSGLFRNLIQPVLSHRGTVHGVAEQLDPAKMALFWGTQGRLLQRTPAVAELIIPPANSNGVSPAIQALLLANDAFTHARQYDKLAAARGKPPADYLVTAHQNTLAALPKKASEATHRLSDLLALVDAFDPQGNATDAELLRLGGYVRRQQAYQEKNVTRRDELAREAAARYTKSSAAAPAKDPLQTLVCAELSELHLLMASWTEVTRADYDQLADQTTQPPLGSKSYHLWRAAALAQQWRSLAPQQAESCLALANAQEQMAFALGLTANYSQALESLEQGRRIAVAKSPLRDQLRATKGRCLLRQAQELFSELTAEERTDHLTAAIAEFDAALADRRATRQWALQDAELLFHLAEAQISLAAQSEADRSRYLAQAEAVLRTAVEAADSRSPKLSLYRWRLLQVLSSQSSETSRPAQKFADEIFLAAEKHPADQDPTAIFGIATATSRLFPEPSKLLRWLPAKGPWFDQWRSNDAWKLEAARLYSEAALSSSLPDLRRTAQQLALELPQRSQPRRLAEAYLQDSLARQLCREFERLKPPSSTVSENSQRSYEADRQAKAVIATSAVRDCCQKHWDCQDDRIQSLLTEINRASPADLLAAKVLPNATVLEKRALWKFVTTSPSLEARDKYLEICEQQRTLMTAADNPNREDLTQTARELLKPVLFFAELAPRDARLDAFLKRHKPAAETEKKK